MEQSVLFRDNQEVEAADFNNMQQYVTDSIDDVVVDAIWQTMAYSGFTISKSSPTEITIAPGRLYSAGKVYGNRDPSVISVYNYLPNSQKIVLAVISWGSTITIDVEPRGFLVDADTGQAQPQDVAMEQDRYANVGVLSGVESAQPQNPVPNSTQLLLGYVLLDPTGVITVTQYTQNKIGSVEDLDERETALEIWRAQITGQVDTLQTALANLAAQLKNYVLMTDFMKLVTLVNQIWAIVNKPSTYIWYGTDNFLDTTQSQTSANVDGAYSATINEGLRFPGSAAATSTTLALLNPSDPGVVIVDDLMLPKPSGSRVRLDASFVDLPWIVERLLSFTYWTFTVRKLRPSRVRQRCGPPYNPSNDASVWQRQAQLDPVTNILAFSTETWTPVPLTTIAAHPEGGPDYPRPSAERFTYYWRDYVDRPYWGKVFDNFTHSANHICQTHLNGQDGWLSGITLFSMNKLAQPLTVIISSCDDQGVPDHINQTIQRVVLDGAGVQACYDNVTFTGDVEVINARGRVKVYPVNVFPLRIPIPLMFMEAGKRYAVHVLSTFDHQFAVSDLWDLVAVHQGDYWVSGSGGLYRWPTAPRSLRFMLHFATWGQWQGQSSVGGNITSTITMAPLEKSGGIGGIDILAEQIEPPATDISPQVQIAGVWKPFNSSPNAPDFSSNPALLPFRIVFTGTTDLMGAISLTNSRVMMNAPRSTTFHHISTSFPLGSAATHVEVISKLQAFQSGHHTVAASLHYAGPTHKTADVVADVTNDDGSITRTWTFNTASISSFVVEHDGTQDGAVDPFYVTQAIRYAAP